jgi:hypothetical protein
LTYQVLAKVCQIHINTSFKKIKFGKDNLIASLLNN